MRFIVSMLCDAEHLHEETVDLANLWYTFYSTITHLFSAVTLRFGMSWQPKSLLPDIFLCNLTIVSSFIFFFCTFQVLWVTVKNWFPLVNYYVSIYCMSVTFVSSGGFMEYGWLSYSVLRCSSFRPLSSFRLLQLRVVFLVFRRLCIVIH